MLFVKALQIPFSCEIGGAEEKTTTYKYANVTDHSYLL